MFFLKILVSPLFLLLYGYLAFQEIIILGLLVSINFSIMAPSKIAPTTKTPKSPSRRYLCLLCLAGIQYLPSRIHTSPTELSLPSPLGIGVLADVILMSTVIEVTETVPPPPTATMTAAPGPNTTAATATTAAATNIDSPASVTQPGADGSQTKGGGGQATVQLSGTVGAAIPTNSGEVQVSGLAGTNTAFISVPVAPSGGTTFTTLSKASPTTTSTTSNSTSPSTHKFPTYAAALASGTAIIAAAGTFTVIYVVRRRHRRSGRQRKPGPVKEIGQVNNRPFSIRKVSLTNIKHISFGIDGNKLTSMTPPPDIDPETSWPKGHMPPDPEELRERMHDERRRSDGRGMGPSDSPADQGVGYVSSSAGVTPSGKREGYFDGYHPENARRLSGTSMPDHMKPFMTPLKPRHTKDFVQGPVNRFDTISPSIYSRHDSIVTSVDELYSKIDGNNNLNLQKEEYRLRKEQARQQFGSYDFVEEGDEALDDCSKPDKGLENSERLGSSVAGGHSNPYTMQNATSGLTTENIGSGDYFSTQHSAMDEDTPRHHNDYFSTRHATVDSDNGESQYEDIDLSQNDKYGEGTTNNAQKSSGSYFGRLFGTGSR